LLKQQSVLRNSKTRGAAREEIAGTLAARSGECRNNPEQLVPVMSMDEECNPGIEMIGPIIRGGGGGRHDCVAVPYTKAKRAQSDTDDETWVEGQVNPTLSLFDCGDVRATTVAIQAYSVREDAKANNFSATPTDVGLTVSALVPGVQSHHAQIFLAQAIPLDLRNSQRDPEKHDAQNRQGLGVGSVGDPAPTVDASFVHGVAVDTLHQQGYNANYASTEEANAVETLRVLQQEIGEEAFTAWGFGILDSLQPTKVLRSRLHGAGIRCATFSRSWAVYCAISREKNRAAGALQSVQEAEGKGCSPSGRELPEQLAEQLGAYLSQLSQPGTQFERLMHHLRCACKGVGILRQALSAIQETQRPVDVEGQTPTAMMVRRLTPIECEFLQGFPRDYTLIPWRKKAADDCPDGPRYKALGNSMAVNCMEWIGERIAALEAEKETT
jgi:DNA (cytosine-5)-methyltransferase 1